MTGERKHEYNKIRCFRSIVSLLLCFVMLFDLTGSLPVANAAETMTSLKKKIDAAQAEYDAALQAEEDAAEKRSQGSLGFIDYMLAKTDIDEKQRFDLEKARTVITDAMEEDFSGWYGGDSTGMPESRNGKVTCTGDRYDAISLDNYQTMFDTLELVNYYRDQDDIFVGSMKRNPAYTNFYFMAIAQTGADRGAGLMRHAYLQVSCENLAFGISGAAWYGEKGSFKAAMDELGMTELTSESDKREVSAKATEMKKETGHYTNLFWSKDQVMGVGFTNYKGTSCYNASATTNYSGKYALYTIDEFEELYNEYYDTVDPKVFAKAVEDAKLKLENLKNQYYELCPAHEFGESTVVEPDCVNNGYTGRTCKVCGFTEKTNITEALGHDLIEGVCSRCELKTVKTLNYPTWKLSSNYYSSVNSLKLEEGKEIPFRIDYTSANEYGLFEEFVVEISDTSVLQYTPETNSTGLMKTIKPGLVTVTVYGKNNPALKRVVTVDVTDVGGHTYEPQYVKTLEDSTLALISKCSGCGREISEGIPHLTGKTACSGDNSSYSYVSKYSVEAEKTLYIEFFWNNYTQNAIMDCNEIMIESSDELVVKFASGTKGSSYYKATFDVLKPGDVTITAHPKYDPENAVTVTIDATDIGGHNYVITPAKELAEETTAVCSGCGKEIIVKIPSLGQISYLSSTGSGYSYNYGDQEKNLAHSFTAGSETSIKFVLNNKQNYTGLDNNEIVVVSSDESVIRFTEGSVEKYYSYWIGNFTCGKAGVAEVTFYPKYNPTSRITIKAIVMDENSKPVSKITLSSDTYILVLGENDTVKINAEIEPDDAFVKDLLWRSDNSAIATVDKNGNVTAVSKGYTYIYAYSIDGSNKSGYKAIKVYDTQAVPVVKASDFTVIENKITTNLSGNYQYRIKKNGEWGSWTTYGTFTKLEPKTKYEIAVRYRENSTEYLAASDEVLVTITTPDHTIVDYGEVEPTCTTSGYTSGKKCSVCGEIFEYPESVLATGHSWEKKSTSKENGYNYDVYGCDKCGNSFKLINNPVINPQVPVSAFISDSQNAKYSVDSTNVLTINSSGIINAKRPGSAVITVTVLKDTFTVNAKVVPGGEAISLGKTVAEMTDGRTARWYSFTPTESAVYRIYSSGDQDTYVTLYDSEGTAIGSDDDSGEDSNFDQYSYLTAGTTYYYEVRSYRYATGIEFNVTLEKDETRHMLKFESVDPGEIKTINVYGTDGCYSGDVGFTVASDDVCWVFVSKDNGKTYTRLSYTGWYYYYNGYYYVVNVDSDTIVTVVKAGDFNLDGKVDSADALQILRYDVNKLTNVSALSLVAGNVGGNDSVINSADALLVLRYDVGKTSFSW